MNAVNGINPGAFARNAGSKNIGWQSYQNMTKNMPKKSKNTIINALSKAEKINKSPSNTTASVIANATKSYAENLKMQRQQTKQTSLSMKKLKYRFKDISSKIISSKTSASAKRVVSQARREVLRLKKEKQNGGYDSEEIEAAITHAKAMERIAKKKVKHLEEEEMAKAAGGICADSAIAEEDDKKAEDAYNQSGEQYSEDEEYLEDEEYPGEEYLDEPGEWDLAEYSMDELAADMLNSVSELMADVDEGMRDMLEEMGFDELSDSAKAIKGDMDPADLKELKIKHRNKEMKDIVKADADYMKVAFKHLEQSMSRPNPPASNAAMPVISAVSPGMEIAEPVINISV